MYYECIFALIAYRVAKGIFFFFLHVNILRSNELWVLFSFAVLRFVEKLSDIGINCGCTE